MLLSMMKISPPSDKVKEVVDILRSVKGPTLAASGCLECSIYSGHDEGDIIFYVEGWRTWAELIAHLRSPLYARVLKSLELSDRTPELKFYEISGTHGIELVENMRSSMLAKQ